MKKILLLLLLVVLSGCECTINGIPLEVGATQTFETKDYLIIYEITSFNGFGQPNWEFKEIRNKNIKSDSICIQ